MHTAERTLNSLKKLKVVKGVLVVLMTLSIFTDKNEGINE
jgi:hypothetical protein